MATKYSENDLDEITHDIKRKADALDTADYNDVAGLCNEIRDLLDNAEAMAEHLLSQKS